MSQDLEDFEIVKQFTGQVSALAADLRSKIDRSDTSLLFKNSLDKNRIIAGINLQSKPSAPVAPIARIPVPVQQDLSLPTSILPNTVSTPAPTIPKPPPVINPSESDQRRAEQLQLGLVFDDNAYRQLSRIEERLDTISNTLKRIEKIMLAETSTIEGGSNASTKTPVGE